MSSSRVNCKVVARGCVEMDLALLVNCLEPEAVLDVPIRLTHREHPLERSISKVTPMLALVWENHGVAQRLDHDETAHRDEIGFVRLVVAHALVVPLRNLGMLLECSGVDAER